MQRKSMDLAAERRSGKGWRRLDIPRPGGMRDGRMLRFAEADTDFGFCKTDFVTGFNTAGPGRGLAVLSPQSGRNGAPPPGVIMPA